MDFVWIYAHAPSFYSKSGLFNELDYSVKSVKKYYKNARCFVVGDKPPADAVHLGSPPRVMTHKSGHPDHFDVLNKFMHIINDDRVNEEFILMYDDIFLMQPMTKRDFKNYGRADITDPEFYMDYFLYRGGSRMYLDMWRTTYDFIRTIRNSEGQKTYDWETHMPRLLNKAGLLDVINKNGLKYVPILITSMFSHEYGGETTMMKDNTLSELETFRPGKTDLDKEFSCKFMNVADDGLTVEVIKRLRDRLK